MTLDGIININKEQNMTSHDVVGWVRRILGVKRVGHTGTLDPMATGVLPVCVGRAARVTEYLDTDLKCYRCVMKLGRSTNTYDIWGETTCESSPEEINKVTEDEIRKAFSRYSGMIRQLPPLYSAVKVNGKRLYEYARKGRDVEIPEREVYITSLTVEDMKPGIGEDSWVRFSCECTKGTFIRSICHDVGEVLGVHACLAELTRTASGIFREEDSVTLDELREICGRDGRSVSKDMLSQESMARLTRILHTPDEVLGFLGEVTVEEKDALRLINGLEIENQVYQVRKPPLYRERDFYFPVKEEYRRLYRIYSNFDEDTGIPGRPNGVGWYPERDDGLRFIGIAVMNEDNDHLIPQKIFI